MGLLNEQMEESCSFGTSFKEQGFWIERQLFTEEECDFIKELAYNLPESALEGLKPLMNPHRLNPDFLIPMKQKKLLAFIEAFIGKPVRGIQSQFFFCQPGTVGFANHQDNFFVQAPKDAFVSSWLALEDVDETNGCLQVYPGSHLEDILSVQETQNKSTYGQNPNAVARECVFDKDKYTMMDVKLKKGDVVFIHGYVVHGSRDNTSTNRHRHSFLMNYIRGGEPYRKGFDSGREDFSVTDE